jgi:HD-like signal output (HDOD) protein
MPAKSPEGQVGWIRALSVVEIPVLRRTVDALAHLREREENLVARDISRVLLHDPMFTLRVLRFLPTQREPERPTEITTVEHALMMLGVSPFFRHFGDLPAVESNLESQPQALDGLMRVIDRARHAALYAGDWAGIRHDVESDEVVIAALLHGLAEMLLWCFAPQLMLRVADMLREDRSLRSSAAQRAVFGFTLIELQLALIAEWKLPALLQSLMDHTHARQPRAINVLLAVDLARHSANGWDDPALPDDYAAIQRLLSLPEEEVRAGIRRIALLAENERSGLAQPPASAGPPPYAGH